MVEVLVKGDGFDDIWLNIESENGNDLEEKIIIELEKDEIDMKLFKLIEDPYLEFKVVEGDLLCLYRKKCWNIVDLNTDKHFFQSIEDRDLLSVEIFIRHGAGRRMDYKSPPLYLASKIGHIGIVRLLLNNDFAMDDGPDKTSPLTAASKNGRIPVVKELLEYGAPSSADLFGNTPLHWAIFKNNLKLIGILDKYRI